MSRSLQLASLRTGDIFQTPSVPRSCSVQITKLRLNKGVHRDEPHFFLAFQASSRRVLARVDEIPVQPASQDSDQEGLLDNPLNVSFEYQHFTKNRSNNLYISLQKRRKYRAPAGFKGVGRCQINLDDVVQCPPTLPLVLKLYQNDKESKDLKQNEIGSIEIAEIMTIPTEDSKYDSTDTEDEENSNETSRKMVKSNSVASRVKSVRLLKKFIEKVLSQKQHIHEDMQINIQELNELGINDFHLYDELDEYGISDDEEAYFQFKDSDDNVSFTSTPRPNIKPYFDTASQSSFQLQHSSGGRSAITVGKLPSLDEEKKNAEMESTDNDGVQTETTTLDTTEEIEDNRHRKSSKKFTKSTYKNQKSFESGDEHGLSAENSSLLSDAIRVHQPLIVLAIKSVRNVSVIDSLMSLNGEHENLFVIELVKEHMIEAFHVLVRRLHQINLKQKLKAPIRICVCGSGDCFNQMVQIYFDEINKKSSEWGNYFSFIFISTEFSTKQDLSSRFADLCPTYKKMFADIDWTSSENIAAKFGLILANATYTNHIPVGEALISFIDEQMDGNTQLIVPFCAEVSISEIDNFDSDSDCDEKHSKTLSPTGSPFNNYVSNDKHEKLQLCIDFWAEDKDAKQNMKETLKSLEFTPLKNSIKMSVNIKQKRGGIGRLPGRKQGSEIHSKHKTEHITRAICKSRNAVEKSKISKISIDSTDYHHISYFQICKLAASGHTKTFPIALFTTNM